MDNNKYKEIAGCNDREEYLEQLAEEHGTDVGIVNALSSILGEEEDFDGLVAELDDFECLGML